MTNMTSELFIFARFRAKEGLQQKVAATIQCPVLAARDFE
jgi:hypothetical protein